MNRNDQDTRLRNLPDFENILWNWRLQMKTPFLLDHRKKTEVKLAMRPGERPTTWSSWRIRLYLQEFRHVTFTMPPLPSTQPLDMAGSCRLLTTLERVRPFAILLKFSFTKFSVHRALTNRVLEWRFRKGRGSNVWKNIKTFAAHCWGTATGPLMPQMKSRFWRTSQVSTKIVWISFAQLCWFENWGVFQKENYL